MASECYGTLKATGAASNFWAGGIFSLRSPSSLSLKQDKDIPTQDKSIPVCCRISHKVSPLRGLTTAKSRGSSQGACLVFQRMSLLRRQTSAKGSGCGPCLGDNSAPRWEPLRKRANLLSARPRNQAGVATTRGQMMVDVQPAVQRLGGAHNGKPSAFENRKR